MIDAPPAIEVRDVSWRYPRQAEPALNAISFNVAEGACFGLLGPNGAGKSTLFSLMSGMRRVRHGDIRIAGHSARTELRRVRSMIALAPQDFAFYPPLTTRENLRFFAGAYGLETSLWSQRFEEVIDICRLSEVVDRRAETYSGGLKRRLNLAIALLNKPRILYLDEPTVGIDARSRILIVEAVARIRSEGATIIYTSHYMEEVETLCDSLAVIDKGRVVAQGPIGDFVSAREPGRVRIKLGAAPPAETRGALEAQGARFIDARQFDAPVAAPADIADLIRRLASMGLEPAQVRYGENRLEQVYVSLISDGVAA